jgi:mannose-6-phosphate isomerase-like protein (cupin superfamily)
MVRARHAQGALVRQAWAGLEPATDRQKRVRGRDVLSNAWDGASRRSCRRGDYDIHWETEQEDFLVLSGECIAIIEGQERRLHRWDFVHCPPGTKHAFVGVGEEPCVLLCAGSRQFRKDGPWGYYCYDETAESYNAASPEDTQDGEIAYGRFPEPREAHYPGGLLPE